MLTRIIQIAVPFIWFGAVAVISFMEAPLKFRAPGITLAEGLSIGRLVFFALNKIELVLAATFALSLIGSRPVGRLTVVLFSIVAGILLVETVVLLPVLDARSELVIQGTPPPYSITHIVYIVMDAVKVCLLLALGIMIARRSVLEDVAQPK
jgi:hypothetical protein